MDGSYGVERPPGSFFSPSSASFPSSAPQLSGSSDSFFPDGEALAGRSLHLRDIASSEPVWLQPSCLCFTIIPLNDTTLC